MITARGLESKRMACAVAALVSVLWAGDARAQAAGPTAASTEGPAATAATSVSGPISAPRATPLIVAAAGSDPFVRKGKDGLEGLSIGVWREVARAAGVSYRIEPYGSVDAALDAVTTGHADVAVGPISITSARAERVAFTQPYYQSSLGILAPVEESSVLQRLTPFFTRAFLVGTATLLLVLGTVGALLWLAERKKNPRMFPHSPVRGVASGVWLGLVTMTTVGYGDHVPVTFVGRLIAGVWMIVAMLTVSSLTAGIATALTVSELGRGAVHSITELRGQKVAAVSGTVGARFARERGTRVVGVPTLSQGIELLADERVAAVVHDRPILQHILNEHPDLDAALAEAKYRPQGYGFALRQGSQLAPRLSVTLLKLGERRILAPIVERWLGPSSQ
jgi:polar amino acid transport system substrate-binding protein